MEHNKKNPCNGIDIEPFAYAISLIDGKWKMLSSQLKDLERDGMLIRKEYPQVPPKVEYSLSELGQSLIPILEEICEWGHLHYVKLL